MIDVPEIRLPVLNMLSALLLPLPHQEPIFVLAASATDIECGRELVIFSYADLRAFAQSLLTWREVLQKSALH